MNYSECDNKLIDLCKKLLSIESITPAKDEIIIFTKNYLEKLGFRCFVINSKTCKNIYAEIGEGPKNICFAGHLDVVAPGNGWKFPPFEATIEDRKIYGRGAVDMKGAIAAAIIAGYNFSMKNNVKFSLMLVGDEEDHNNYGTQAILDYLDSNKTKIDYVILGEPTNPEKLGQMAKIGRRGSISFKLKIIGQQGHVAHPENTINPIKIASKIIENFYNSKIDDGDEYFVPSNLEFTNVYVGNESRNVIPNTADLFFNIRYNPLQDENSIVSYVTKIIDQNISSAKYELEYNNSALPFINVNNELINAVKDSIREIHSQDPEIATIGGTSDARFIYKYFPVIEYGLSFKLAHHIDEYLNIDELIMLKETYGKIFEKLANI